MSSNRPIQSGDRVKIYGWTPRGFFRGGKGTVTRLNLYEGKPDTLEIDVDGYTWVQRRAGMHMYSAHPHQCRRLIKRRTD